MKRCSSSGTTPPLPPILPVMDDQRTKGSLGWRAGRPSANGGGPRGGFIFNGTTLRPSACVVRRFAHRDITAYPSVPERGSRRAASVCYTDTAAGLRLRDVVPLDRRSD